MKTELYYNTPAEQLLQQLGVKAGSGLSEEEAKERLARYGPNRLQTTRQKSLFKMFFEQFKSSMVVILLAAAVISGVVGVLEGEGLMETFVILAILLINALIGTFQEKGGLFARSTQQDELSPVEGLTERPGFGN